MRSRSSKRLVCTILRGGYHGKPKKLKELNLYIFRLGLLYLFCLHGWTLIDHWISSLKPQCSLQINLKPIILFINKSAWLVMMLIHLESLSSMHIPNWIFISLKSFPFYFRSFYNNHSPLPIQVGKLGSPHWFVTTDWDIHIKIPNSGCSDISQRVPAVKIVPKMLVQLWLFFIFYFFALALFFYEKKNRDKESLSFFLSFLISLLSHKKKV